MKKLMLIIISALLLFPSIAIAQQYNYYGRAATYEESYLRGLGYYNSGVSDYLKGLGQYQQRHQKALKQMLENNDTAIRMKWKLQDDRKVRLYSENNLDRMSKRLDNAQRYHDLKEREKAMISAGVLPAKAEKSCVIRGRSYNDISEWIGTVDYELNRLEQIEKDMCDEIEKLQIGRRQKQATGYLAKWEREGWYSYNNHLVLQNIRHDLKEPKLDNKLNFPLIDDEINSHIEILKDIRSRQEYLKDFIKTNGNIKVSD